MLIIVSDVNDHMTACLHVTVLVFCCG